jgi:hypothetical protein
MNANQIALCAEGATLYAHGSRHGLQADPGKAFGYHPGTARSPLNFFLLVFALTAPFWMIGAVTGFQLLPAATVDWTGPSG